MEADRYALDAAEVAGGLAPAGQVHGFARIGEGVVGIEQGALFGAENCGPGHAGKDVPPPAAAVTARVPVTVAGK